MLTVIALIAASGADPDYSKFKLTRLQRMLFVRGVPCETCTKKEDFLARVRDAASLPEIPEKVTEWERQREYKRKVKEYNMTRDEFADQMRDTAQKNMTDSAMERMWQAYQEQLNDGTVEFVDGSVKFTLPLTHTLSAYLPDAVADAIEDTYRRVRAAYVRLVPSEKRRRVEEVVAYLDDKHILHSLAVGLVLFVCVDVLRDRRQPAHAHAGPPEANAPEAPAAAPATRARAAGRKKSD